MFCDGRNEELRDPKKRRETRLTDDREGEREPNRSRWGWYEMRERKIIIYSGGGRGRGRRRKESFDGKERKKKKKLEWAPDVLYVRLRDK